MARSGRFAFLASLLSAALAGAPAHAQQSLIFLTDDIPAGLDSDGPAAAIPTSQTGIVNVMEPLVSYASSGVNAEGVDVPDFTRFEGRLAERWSFDPKSLTWTFKLREGVKSCAGNELTADDVVYTFARAKSVSGAAPIGWFLSSVASIDTFTGAVLTDRDKRALGDEVRKVDRYTVTIRQSAPNALFLPALTTFGLLIFDSTAAKANATAADPWAHDFVNTVAAPAFGPYCVERWVRGSEMVLRANPNYYRGAPAIPRIVMKRIPQSSNRFILMRMGQAQLTEHLTPREYARLKTVNGVKVSGIAGNETLFVHMNYKSPPFDDVRVRQAVAAALPDAWILRNGYFGEAKPWDGVVPSSYPGAQHFPDAFKPDPARARALLAAAGYPDGRGLERYQDSFRLAYPAERETSLGPIATAVQTALRRIGVPAELDPIPATQYGDRELVKKDLPFALNDQEKPIVVDAGYAVQLFFASAAAGGVNNMVNYANPAVDAMWAEARNEADPQRRDALLGKIQTQLVADVAWAPVVEFKTQWAHAPNLGGLSWMPDNAIRFASLRFAP